MLAACLVLPAQAETGVAVLDFELIDLTLSPRGEEELRRVATLKPLLEKALAARGDYRFAPVDSAAQAAAAKGATYLGDHPEEAAALCDPNQTEFVVVGTLTKPSFLFVYLGARLIGVRDGRLIGEYQVEIKGQQNEVTPRGIARLAEDMDARMRAAARTPRTP